MQMKKGSPNPASKKQVISVSPKKKSPQKQPRKETASFGPSRPVDFRAGRFGTRPNRGVLKCPTVNVRSFHSQVVWSEDEEGKAISTLVIKPASKLPGLTGHDFMPGKGERMTSGPKGVGLSDCALGYAKALANPFGNFEDYPCVPSSPAISTQKWRSLTRGDFVTSATTALGYVAVTPTNFGRDALASRVASVVNTTPTFVGTTITNTLPTTGVTGLARSSLPYTVAQGQSGITGRLVGLGLRVQNVTSQLALGGEVIALQVSTDESLEGVGVADLMNDPRSVRIAAKDIKDWCQIVWRPNDQFDLSLNPISTPSDLSLVIMAISPGSAAPFTPQEYAWEIVEFWEFMGQAGDGTVVPEMTVSMADTVGLDRVISGTASTPISLESKDWNLSTAEGIVDAMAHSDTVSKTIEDLLGLAGMAVPAAMNLVSNLTSFFAL